MQTPLYILKTYVPHFAVQNFLTQIFFLQIRNLIPIWNCIMTNRKLRFFTLNSKLLLNNYKTNLFTDIQRRVQAITS